MEAFANAVAEGRRIGMTDKELVEYLRTEWMSEDDLRKLATELGVKYEQ